MNTATSSSSVDAFPLIACIFGVAVGLYLVIAPRTALYYQEAWHFAEGRKMKLNPSAVELYRMTGVVILLASIAGGVWSVELMQKNQAREAEKAAHDRQVQEELADLEERKRTRAQDAPKVGTIEGDLQLDADEAQIADPSLIIPVDEARAESSRTYPWVRVYPDAHYPAYLWDLPVATFRYPRVSSTDGPPASTDLAVAAPAIPYTVKSACVGVPVHVSESADEVVVTIGEPQTESGDPCPPSEVRTGVIPIDLKDPIGNRDVTVR